MEHGIVQVGDDKTGIFIQKEKCSTIGRFFWKYDRNEKTILLKIRWRNEINYICKLKFDGRKFDGKYVTVDNKKDFCNYDELNEDPSLLNLLNGNDMKIE